MSFLVRCIYCEFKPNNWGCLHCNGQKVIRVETPTAEWARTSREAQRLAHMVVTKHRKNGKHR